MGLKMDRLLHAVLSRIIRKGTLGVTTARGGILTLGDGTGKPIAIRFTTLSAQRAVLLDPDLKLGEVYMDGALVIEEGSIEELLALALSQSRPAGPLRWLRPLWIARYLNQRLRERNGRNRAKKNVAHHYDLDGRLYALFLDADRQYSCGYFETPDQSLDEAQLAKKRHLAAKLLVKPGHTVLDIGSGWGGLALYLTETCGARTTGITLSKEQIVLARARAAEKGLSHAVNFLLQDYRDVTGPFDRIVSVGMFEHVGVAFYDAFFRKCASLLADDGVFLLHAIGRSEPPGITNPWIAKYIFPGGYAPALSEVLPAIERAGLLVTDIEILRQHYAETLKAWRARFLARREEAARLYDERFVRMWEFYLAACEMGFREQALMVFQIQMTKRQGVAPMTRDYVAREEARLREIEHGYHVPFGLAGE
jgi:cyclopropane-fatty-acyl-phospholipid synthase